MAQGVIPCEVVVESGDLVDHAAIAAFQRQAFVSVRAPLAPASVQTSAYYAWKYRTPWGPARLATVTCGGDVASMVAAIPTVFALESTGGRPGRLATLRPRRACGVAAFCDAAWRRSSPTCPLATGYSAYLIATLIPSCCRWSFTMSVRHAVEAGTGAATTRRLERDASTAVKEHSGLPPRSPHQQESAQNHVCT